MEEREKSKGLNAALGEQSPAKLEGCAMRRKTGHEIPRFSRAGLDHCASVDMLYFALTTLSGVMMLLIFLTILYFCFKYRARQKGDRSPARPARR